MLRDWIFYEADSGGNDGQDSGDDDTGNDDSQDVPASLDEWLSDQPDTIKNLIDSHTDGLRSALNSERAERKKLSQQLKTLGAKAEKGSELESEIAKLTGTLEENQRKADFYERAHTAGVKNLRLAYLAATDGDLFDRDGDVNFDKLKEQAPELFASKEKQPTPKGNAGAGRGQGGATPSMNSFIRRAAGREG